MPQIKVTDKRNSISTIVDWEGPEPPSTEEARSIIDQHLEQQLQDAKSLVVAKQKVQAVQQSVPFATRALAAAPDWTVPALNKIRAVGESAVNAVVGMPASAVQAGRGFASLGKISPELQGRRRAGATLADLAGPFIEEQAGPIADIGEGAFGVVAPIAIAARPLQAAKILPLFMGGEYMGGEVSRRLGAGPNVQRLAGLVTGAALGGAVATGKPRVVEPKTITPPQASQIAPTVVPAVATELSTATKVQLAKPEVKANRASAAIYTAAGNAGVDSPTWHSYIQATFGKTSSKELTLQEAGKLIKDLKAGRVKSPIPPVAPPVAQVVPPVAPIMPEVVPTELKTVQQPLATAVEPPAPAIIQPASVGAKARARAQTLRKEVKPKEEVAVSGESLPPPSLKTQTESVWSDPAEGARVFKHTLPDGKVSFSAELKGDLKGEFATQGEAIRSFGEQIEPKTVEVKAEPVKEVTPKGETIKEASAKIDRIIEAGRRPVRPPTKGRLIPPVKKPGERGSFAIERKPKRRYMGEGSWIFPNGNVVEVGSEALHSEIAAFKGKSPEKLMREGVVRTRGNGVEFTGGADPATIRAALKHAGRGVEEIFVDAPEGSKVYYTNELKANDWNLRKTEAHDVSQAGSYYGSERGSLPVNPVERQQKRNLAFVGSWINSEGQIKALKSHEDHLDPSVLKRIGTDDPFENNWTRLSGNNVQTYQEAIHTFGFDTAVHKAAENARQLGQPNVNVDVTFTGGRKSASVALNDLGEFLSKPEKFLVEYTRGWWTNERGSLKIGPQAKHDIERAKGTLGAAVSQIESYRYRVKQEGKSGKELMERIDEMTEAGESESALRLVKLYDSKLRKIKTDDEKLQFVGAIQGKRAATSQIVKNNIDTVQPMFADVADQAELAGVETKLRSGEVRPFQRMEENYFPHYEQTIDELKNPRRVSLTLDNMVENEGFKSRESAQKLIDSEIAFRERGGRERELIAYVMKKNPKLTEDEAFNRLLLWRKAGIKRQGSLEFAREIDLPTYEPDPTIVLPKYFHETSMRLSHIESLGQKDQVVRAYYNKIRKEGKDYEFVKEAVSTMLRHAANADTKEQRATRFFRTTHGFLLGPTSTIKNAFQGEFGSLLKSKDLPSVFYGFRKSWTKQGRRLGLESGAALDSVIQESVKHAGGSSAALQAYLRGIGWSKVERRTRTVAANTGYYWSQKLIKQARGEDKKAKWATEQLVELIGPGAHQAIAEGQLNNTQLLRAAKRFSDLTQFRSRPQDLPKFASTGWGKVFFQFKAYSYGQSQLVYNSTIGELKSGRFGRFASSLAILLGVYPAGGEIARDITNIMTGKQDDSEGLKRYFGNMFMLGALGVLGDAAQSGEIGKGTEMVVGPTFSTIGEAIKIAGQGGKGLERAAVRRIPGVGPLIRHRAFPPEEKKSPYSLPKVRSLESYQTSP